MENNSASNSDKISINKAKSYSNDPPKKLKSEPVKRKSFNVNEAVRSLDLALGRLKKSKLVNGEYGACPELKDTFDRDDNPNMFVDSHTSRSLRLLDVDNASSMSMNFSHYELMRNLSSSNCNSDGELSSTTCTGFSSLSDIASRNEHLERYFRSVETWGRNRKVGKSDFKP